MPSIASCETAQKQNRLELGILYLEQPSVLLVMASNLMAMASNLSNTKQKA